MKPDDKFLDAFARIGAKQVGAFGAPPSKKLSMLLRPTFIARPGKVLVWGDWSAIEARVLPWLAASPGAEEVLDIFRTNDLDPNLPDIYIITAAELMDRVAEELWALYRAGEKEGKDARQAYGKVPVLSLGFGGALGALLAMATNYNVYLDEVTAKRVVAMWRAKNAWAPDFWGKHTRNESTGLWGMANQALLDPDTPKVAGAVAFVFDKKYMGGTLFCYLPDGRPLTYPKVKWEWRTVVDKKTKAEEEKYQLTFLKQYGRSAAWYGKFAENVTQATAASILRRSLKIIEYTPELQWMDVVMHTHDEIVVEVDEADEERAKVKLHEIMVSKDPWMEGLPLAAEISSGWAYSKAG